MTNETKNIEKLAQEAEKLLMKEMERRYIDLRKKCDLFIDAKEKKLENTKLPPEKVPIIMFEPIELPSIKTPWSEYADAIDNYKFWAKHLESFGLSVGHCTLNINSYEESLK